MFFALGQNIYFPFFVGVFVFLLLPNRKKYDHFVHVLPEHRKKLLCFFQLGKKDVHFFLNLHVFAWILSFFPTDFDFPGRN